MTCRKMFRVTILGGLLGIQAICGCGRDAVVATSGGADLSEFFDDVPAIEGQQMTFSFDGEPADLADLVAGETVLCRFVVQPPERRRVEGPATRIGHDVFATLNWYVIGGEDGSVEVDGRPALAISADRTKVFENNWFLERVDGPEWEAGQAPDKDLVPGLGEAYTFECPTVLPTRAGQHTAAVILMFHAEVDRETGENVHRTLATTEVTVRGPRE